MPIHIKDGKISKTYSSWSATKQRCFNQSSKDYPRYGGAGITMCELWRDSFASFLEDMGERPDGTSLDRIDNNGNYEPGNCRWATRATQARNRAFNVFVEYEGQSMLIRDCAALVGVRPVSLWFRIRKKGDSLSAAIAYLKVRQRSSTASETAIRHRSASQRSSPKPESR